MPIKAILSLSLALLMSCGVHTPEPTCYTLKSKKELMKQKITGKNKIILCKP